MKGKIWLIIILCVPLIAVATEDRRFCFEGKVNDKATGVPLEYASVYVEELGIGTISGDNGVFRLEGIPAGSYRIRVHYLGYATTTFSLVLRSDTIRNVELNRFSLELDEVSVLGEARPQEGGSLKIKQEVLKYIQPSSLNDIFQLLPGGLQADGNLSKVNQITSRQAGSDQNTAFGMAIVIDGSPLSNNGNLQGISGTDSKVNERSVLSGGIDLRMISTDHLEEAEIIRGIPSAKYGDITSGVVLLKSKSGISPWQIRVKSDPLNKLGYIGKGFKLPGNRGTLNAGIDFIQARPDVRNQLQNYTRISSSLTYTDKTTLAGQNLNYDLSVKYYGTLESEKNDPDLLAALDSYNSRYNRVTFTANGGWQVNTSWLNRADLTFSADYTADILKRKMTVTPQSGVLLPISQTEGESEGIYLPSEYLSDFREENRPLNFFAQLSAKSFFRTGEINHGILYGYELRYDKNVGIGAVYDLTRPPYPNNPSSSRPREYRSVPAMVQNILFVEDNIRWTVGNHKFDLKAGIRFSGLGNLPGHYKLKGKLAAEPRINLSHSFPVRLGEIDSRLTLRGGYGEHVKYPSLHHLYPDKVWFDQVEANYYSQTPENRFLWIRTQVKDPVNPDLEINRNRKAEGGIDWEIGKTRLSVTGFYERSNAGYTHSAQYFPFLYKKYQISDNLPEGKPSLDNFTSTEDVLLKNYQVPVNASQVIKKGVEYQVNFPEIKPLRTKIILNGAYYHTAYDISLTETYQPSKVINGKPYLYAGIYDWNSESRNRKQFNTTGWFDTHIPAFRLHFTTSLQVLWFRTSQAQWFSGMPQAYIGPDGITRPFTEAERNNPELKDLIRTFSVNYFKPNREPVSIGLNLKATKEIGEKLEISFMINRLWDYNPVYENNMQQEIRKWEIPFFGAELTLKL